MDMRFRSLPRRIFPLAEWRLISFARCCLGTRVDKALSNNSIAQRPCSRCLTNNKEDACVDVQHKKRGRPRLREERDLRYDLSGRGGTGGHPAEAASHRPQMIYGQHAASMGSGYGVSTRRGYSSSNRVMKSQPADFLAPRFIERGSMADANGYPAPLSISTRSPVPAAYLAMDLEISKASSTFSDAVGHHNMKGLNLLDVILPEDRRNIQALLHQMHDERERKDPQYLPPIFATRDRERIIQALGFGQDDMGRFALDRSEYLTFRAHDGQQRAFRVNLGLAKQESIYFIVLLLQADLRPFEHPTPSPQSRDMPYSYQVLQHPPQQHGFPQQTPVSATFDVNRPRLSSEAGLGPILHPPPPGAAMPGLSPSLPSTYSASSGRSDYLAGPSSYQVPRSELGLVARPHHQSPPSGYQLPPIRSRHGTGLSGFSPTARDDKTRVDIGGLIDKPEPFNRRPSR